MTSRSATADPNGATVDEHPHGPDRAAEPVGRFHTLWRGDGLPKLPRLPELAIDPLQDERLDEGLGELDARQIQDRVRRGHRPWLARIAGEVVGWGWCATEEASIGELGISFAIPPDSRYLWDFVTVPAWRGRGIYPSLLQAILAREPEVERFWLGHDLSNVASARGIAKAGFHEVGVLYRLRDGAFALVPTGSLHFAVAASKLFGVSVAAPLGANRVTDRR